MPELTLDFYLRSAEKLIMEHGYPNMLKDSEAIGHVAYMMMLADQRYKEGIGNRDAFRVSYAKYGIKSLKTAYKKRRSHNIVSLDFDVGKGKLQDYIVSDGSVLTDMLRKENMDLILNHSGLSDLQNKYVRLYYLEGMNTHEIAKKFNVSHQSVSQLLERAIDKLRRKWCEG